MCERNIKEVCVTTETIKSINIPKNEENIFINVSYRGIVHIWLRIQQHNFKTI